METKLKHFANRMQAIHHILAEAEETMREDLQRMENADRECYSNADRSEKKKQIFDVDSVGSFVVNACENHDPLIKMLEDMRTQYGKLHDIVSDFIENGRLNESLSRYEYSAIVETLVACAQVDESARKAIEEAT